MPSSASGAEQRLAASLRATPRFITFEGSEGSGKSTQLERLHQRLEGLAVPVISLREPGATALGERVRGILADATQRIEARAELFLFLAARAQLVEERVRPTLGQGKTVLCDRYGDSSVAYQGDGRGLGAEQVRELNRVATGGLMPHLTLLFNLPPSGMAGRLRGRGADKDRIEREDAAFFARVKEGYLAIARAEPERVAVVDATPSIEKVEQEVWRVLVERFA